MKVELKADWDHPNNPMTQINPEYNKHSCNFKKSKKKQKYQYFESPTQANLLKKNRARRQVLTSSLLSSSMFSGLWILLCSVEKNERVYFLNGKVCFHSSFIKHGQQGTARKHTYILKRSVPAFVCSFFVRGFVLY